MFGFFQLGYVESQNYTPKDPTFKSLVREFKLKAEKVQENFDDDWERILDPLLSLPKDIFYEYITYDEVFVPDVGGEFHDIVDEQKNDKLRITIRKELEQLRTYEQDIRHLILTMCGTVGIDPEFSENPPLWAAFQNFAKKPMTLSHIKKIEKELVKWRKTYDAMYNKIIQAAEPAFAIKKDCIAQVLTDMELLDAFREPINDANLKNIHGILIRIKGKMDATKNQFKTVHTVLDEFKALRIKWAQILMNESLQSKSKK